jgi:Ca2+-binding RTX toxin-like protein
MGNGVGRLARRFALASLVAAMLLVAAPTGASAALTLGQLAPGTSPPGECANPDPFDALQPTVSSGNTYVVPTRGTITSWSHNASADGGQMIALKVFRQVSGLTYRVVGHNGPEEIKPSTINTFSGFSIPVQAGDVIGLNDGPPSACSFQAEGDFLLERNGDLADGEEGTFDSRPGRLNITARFEADLKCKGESLTIIGTDGPDDIVGTANRDVIAALGGGDRVKALGGKDIVCGAKGKDKLKGGAGKDKLKGAKGRDRLNGGGGKDKCAGGKGDDTAKKCEIEKSI